VNLDILYNLLMDNIINNIIDILKMNKMNRINVFNINNYGIVIGNKKYIIHQKKYKKNK
jgi:hypothetical protein